LGGLWKLQNCGGVHKGQAAKKKGEGGVRKNEIKFSKRES